MYKNFLFMSTSMINLNNIQRSIEKLNLFVSKNLT